MAEKIDKSSPWYRDDDESILEVYDVETGERTVLQEFDYLIEAPNWSPDGKFLDVQQQRSDLQIRSGDEGRAARSSRISSQTATTTMSLSPEGRPHRGEPRHEGGRKIAHLHGAADGRRAGLITPLAPSYLHGWSPRRQKRSPYCAERSGGVRHLLRFR